MLTHIKMPEIDLIGAFLERMIKDAQSISIKHLTNSAKPTALDCRLARMWVADDTERHDDDPRLYFVECCDILGYNPDDLRKKILFGPKMKWARPKKLTKKSD